jgi:hypothetical protein
MKDIVAMKLSAIADNGTRLKDFVDVACLSTRMSLFDMLRAYGEKFQSSNPVRPLKGLAFHDDINFKEPIRMVGGDYEWERVKNRINDMLARGETVFEELPLVSRKS